MEFKAKCIGVTCQATRKNTDECQVTKFTLVRLPEGTEETKDLKQVGQIIDLSGRVHEQDDFFNADYTPVFDKQNILVDKKYHYEYEITITKKRINEAA